MAADPRPVPPDLTARALAHGRRLVRLRRAVRLVCWTLLLAAAVTAAVLAVRLWPAAQPLPVPAP
nr:hypothetical protein [Streptomyces sp. SID5468]